MNLEALNFPGISADLGFLEGVVKSEVAEKNCQNFHFDLICALGFHIGVF